MKEDEPTNTIYDILTRRERDIIKLIVGCTDKEIAERLDISVNTVRNHHQSILRKTNQHNTKGLIKFLLNNGFHLDM